MEDNRKNVSLDGRDPSADRGSLQRGHVGIFFRLEQTNHLGGTVCEIVW